MSPEAEVMNTLCIIHSSAGSASRLMISPTTLLTNIYDPIIRLFIAAFPDVYAAYNVTLPAPSLFSSLSIGTCYSLNPNQDLRRPIDT